MGSKCADSRKTSSVESSVPVSSPPMIPAMAIGFSESAITRFSGESSLSTPSKVFILSPSFAHLTTTSLPESFLRSKACRGWPSSYIT